MTAIRKSLVAACAAAILACSLAGVGPVPVPETEVRAAGVAGAGAGAQKDRIAIIEPTFTYAAYQNGSFYNFYHMYRTVPRTENITTNLDLLVDSPVPGGPFVHYKAPEKGLTIPHIELHRAVEQHVRAFAPDANITKIGDQHVHNGSIFNPDGTNAYDVLILYHNEYFTQAEYDNLKRFVRDGGTALFTMSNVLYAEVAYNAEKNAITFVKGHDWEFDGKVARKSVGERWPEETREWAGSNFLKTSTTRDILFRNNPFNYTHIEEQYVANPDSRILIDYGAYSPSDPAFNATIATYEKDYGSGKVIMTSLFANRVVGNQTFWDFFDDILLPHAISPAYHHRQPLFSVHGADENNRWVEFSSYWKLKTGSIAGMELEPLSKSVTLSLKRTDKADDTLLVIFPKNIPGVAAIASVEVDGVKTVGYDVTDYDSEVAITVPIGQNSNDIRISFASVG